MIIDISQHNTIKNWDQVKNAVDGVIMRLGYTGYGSGLKVYDKKFFEYFDAMVPPVAINNNFFIPYVFSYLFSMRSCLNSVNSPSTFSSLVAQLVQKRTALWFSSILV